MAKLASILNERFLKRDKTKTSALAQKAKEGTLTSFSGIFGLSKLNATEKEALEDLLRKYAPKDRPDISEDLQSLVSLTSEVRAINNQAAILHGERIKKAQELLKNYRDGAFTTWLIATYGNRQTPYNFLQYYEFYYRMPQTLQLQLETMPRQAIYTLASREGALDKKEEIVRNYKGQTKQELLTLIRSSFPLHEKDGRREDAGETIIAALRRVENSFTKSKAALNPSQKKIVVSLLKRLEEIVK